MALAKPPQASLNFNILNPSSFIKEAKDLVVTSAQVWEKVAKITPQDATFTGAISPIIYDENTRTARQQFLKFLNSVSPSKELRDASHEAERILTRDQVDRWSREDVFRVVDAVWRKEETVEPESRLFLETLREQFLKAGNGLTDEDSKGRVQEGLQKIQVLKADYTKNLNSNVGGLWLTVDELRGVPAAHLERWKADGDRRWVDHKMPNLTPVLQNATRADVRQKVWTSWDNMMKDTNGPVLKDLLILRDEVARTLGYKHHAELRESERILKTDEALEFLDTIRVVFTELGTQELQSLKALKQKQVQEQGLDFEPSPDYFFSWDRAFYQRLAKLSTFHFDEDLVAQYFPFERALERMLLLLEALFGVKFAKYPSNSLEISTWHPDVLTYAVWNDEANGGCFLGYLYLDVFPRDYKYAHKGHYKLQPRFTREDGSRHYPASAFVANYSPPTAARPSLLKYKEVVSCFHELGHSLHNLTSETRHARFHGPAVPRDFVEIPSVMLEHVFWNREILRVVSGRHDSGEEQGGEQKLPDDLIDRLIAGRFANIGLSDLSNLLLSSYDLKIHSPADHDAVCNMNLKLEFNKLRKELCLMSGPEDLGLGLEATHGYSRFRFPTGYDSAYYTYLFRAQAFSYDIFETKFRPHLPSDSAKVAHTIGDIVTSELREEFGRFRQIVLRPGASVTSYLGMLKTFLGRDPIPDAFIQMLRVEAKGNR
ncbi:Thimet oligopeptidase [Tolypocladium ophioglossoides CBS 100239]|uniref:Thimet oligopeptidase n=1 Tax=Tolypocladium ophioglossoides (strain CBS 100239) TaxID=1163406 RepID=A0A0L0NHJ1_TOLOC|nr:Thimet oligopeptidase [Tolypocladium ophioglossoides CBS 100239]